MADYRGLKQLVSVRQIGDTVTPGKKNRKKGVLSWSTDRWVRTNDLFLPPPPPAKSTSTTSYKDGKSRKLSIVGFLHYLTVPCNTKRSKICDDVPYNGNWPNFQWKILDNDSADPIAVAKAEGWIHHLPWGAAPVLQENCLILLNGSEICTFYYSGQCLDTLGLQNAQPFSIKLYPC